MEQDKPYFDIEVTLDKNIADPWPEALWISLPFNVAQPQYRVGRFGSIIDPVKDITVKGVNRYMYNVGTGVALVDKSGAGVGVCPLDATLVSIGETGGWKFDTTYVPTKPYIYFNLFNNQWSTNYRLWNKGKWVYRFRVWPIDKYDNEKSLITPSLEALYPLRSGIKNSGQTNTVTSYPLVKKQAGLSLSRKGILVTAFGGDPFGNEGILLRMWEQAGKSGRVLVTLPARLKVTKALPVNLRSEPIGEAIRVTGNKFSCNVPTFAPVSFLLIE
jgi:alpha-mannosidase